MICEQRTSPFHFVTLYLLPRCSIRRVFQRFYSHFFPGNCRDIRSGGGAVNPRSIPSSSLPFFTSKPETYQAKVRDSVELACHVENLGELFENVVLKAPSVSDTYFVACSISSVINCMQEKEKEQFHGCFPQEKPLAAACSLFTSCDSSCTWVSEYTCGWRCDSDYSPLQSHFDENIEKLPSLALRAIWQDMRYFKNFSRSAAANKTWERSKLNSDKVKVVIHAMRRRFIRNCIFDYNKQQYRLFEEKKKKREIFLHFLPLSLRARWRFFFVVAKLSELHFLTSSSTANSIFSLKNPVFGKRGGATNRRRLRSHVAFLHTV